MQYNKQITRVDKSITPIMATIYYDKACAFCGDAFKASRPRGKYCSQRCANDAYIAWRRMKMEQKRAKAKTCILCSAPVLQGKGRIRLYCSAACKQKAYRNRRQKEDVFNEKTENVTQ